MALPHVRRSYDDGCAGGDGHDLAFRDASRPVVGEGTRGGERIRGAAMTTTDGSGGTSPLLVAMLNLTRVHREHEKFYASAPRERAVTLQRHARTLLALADHWTTATPSSTPASSPFEGADDLNDPAALQLEGVLFMEGEGEPAEITHLVADLRSTAREYAAGGEWLDHAMTAGWEIAAQLIDIEGLSDLLGERHRTIANDSLAAAMQSLIARLLDRAADILDHVDFTPSALRTDLAGGRRAVGLLQSAAELVNRAADLCSESAALVNDNERRWRVVRERVVELVDAG
jgi:hypothetical protein